MSEYEYATTYGMWNWNEPAENPERPPGKGWRLVFCTADPSGASPLELRRHAEDHREVVTTNVDRSELVGMIWTWERVVMEPET